MRLGDFKWGKRERIALLLIVILGTVSILWDVLVPKLNTVSIPKDDESLGITARPEVTTTEGMTKEPSSFFSKDIVNILVIGVDQPSGYADGQRSDIMIMVTLKKGSKDIRMTSFMRDTIAFAPSTENFEKLNMNYKYGGPLETIKAMNMNFDLDIRDFVQFDYDDLRTLVDRVGGVKVYIDEGELKDFNYMAENGEYYHAKPKEKTGWYTLDGNESQIYVRSRLQSGGDGARTGRQREVILEILKKLKTMPAADLYQVARDMLPRVETSYDYSSVFSLLDFYVSIRSSAQFVEGTFPIKHDSYRYKSIWYEVSRNLKKDLKELHRLVYDDESYEPSERVKKYIKKIEAIPFY
ncbi:LCP family protein [Guggenheimella bovis]